MPPAITIDGLEVNYGDAVALCDVRFTLPVGTSLAVIGPNGSGKSTLLGALAGIVEPSAGTMAVAGDVPTLVLQTTEVDKSLPITVRDAVSMARYPTLGLFRRFRSVDREAVHIAMRRMAIEDLANRQIHELSGGQRQRVLVAQGLAQDTNVLLLDEPVTGLDMTSLAKILDVIDEEVEAGRTVVLTTHSLEEARRCNQVLLLDTTQIAFGSPDEVLIERHLRETFGGAFVRVGDKLILDDPHHHHAH